MVTVSEGIFIILVVADAYLAKVAATMGAEEILPWMKYYGSSIIIKAALAILILLALRYWGKQSVLWLVNLALFGVVVWSFLVCAYGHLVYKFPW